MAAPFKLVTFKHGFIAAYPVVAKLLDLEARGATFELLADGRFRVNPGTVLTDDDRTFLREHRDEAKRVIEYQADDTHLFSDQRYSANGVRQDEVCA